MIICGFIFFVFVFQIWSFKKTSAVRKAKAIIVNAGLTDNADGKTELSQMYRFEISNERPFLLTTESPASSPITHVPIMCALR